MLLNSVLSAGCLVKMQILIHWVWVGPEILHV